MLQWNSHIIILTNPPTYLQEDDAIKCEKESGWKTGEVVCKTPPEHLGRRHDASEVQSSAGGKKNMG